MYLYIYIFFFVDFRDTLVIWIKYKTVIVKFDRHELTFLKNKLP